MTLVARILGVFLAADACLTACDPDHDLQTYFRSHVPNYFPVGELMFRSSRVIEYRLNFNCTVGIFKVADGFAEKFQQIRLTPSAKLEPWQSTPMNDSKIDPVSADAQKLACASVRLSDSSAYGSVLRRTNFEEGSYFSTASTTILVYVPKHELLFVIPEARY